MKKAILFLLFLMFAITSCVFYGPHIDYPPTPAFPQRYRTWLNVSKKNGVTCGFDFHNYETSFLPQVCGFDGDGGGAYYERESGRKKSGRTMTIIVDPDFVSRIFISATVF